ncbi:MAG: bifunctional metallophosphatase/5'-nucleotidase [Candidatus Marinimicrobia bacterium]|jgi:5'-nucleotidase / UDP-sugar diphosphatase|nr:bifunctional metallophosphatase/5'-nucleotidase [Candidatus Neomarinimicrobiota bacterium]MBT4361078.1 bifunctional metallophosphatase/5'-nucleotidase [Candidatus Neomarinimicrobiota bacterium]MBT4713500.1 bifunctional metallophosphatase/5'-nucleotidase [Candidatus Neomarinimicrobiota bacterium]MBT4946688.1 bifunctional metallophosphatase/5'-nucleotidase [Candidatus Neomarinimicrobiota bacterium]MBT5268683.1 bifunctional metallophosphatase/5'-nucleotidase [Candidatus Neomarinimicrobiota bact
MKSIKYSLIPLMICFVLHACSKESNTPDSNSPDLTILYTNDEHGWISETSDAEGAAKLLGVWKEDEGYTPNSSYLILSGGDNWTGPAISTWFQGESTVATMNAMGYNAAAIGNHEFDFQVSGLRERVSQADFPYLSANIRLNSNDQIPDFAQAYVIQEVNDILVGIVGLTTTSTSYSTFPAYVEDYHFIPYEDALEEWVPQIWAEGVEIVLCVAHICGNEMRSLVPVASELNITMIGGGHCNELISEIQGDGSVALIEGGWRMDNYARLDIWYNQKEMFVSDLVATTHQNQGGTPDSEVESVVAIWEMATTEALGEVIGYAQSQIPRNSAQMHNLVTDSWLYSYPNADIAFTNTGGIRQTIEAGEITKGDIIGVLPFNNNILELQLTGQQVIDCLENHAVAGMTTSGGYKHADGTAFKLDSVYSVLTTDYLYIQENSSLSNYDPNPYYTEMNYHQPTVDFITSMNTSDTNPLDDYLDYIPRR